MSKPRKPNSSNRHQVWNQDCIPGTSFLNKEWASDETLVWTIEARTENRGAGTFRLGEIIVSGSFNGELTARIREEYVP